MIKFCLYRLDNVHCALFFLNDKRSSALNAFCKSELYRLQDAIMAMCKHIRRRYKRMNVVERHTVRKSEMEGEGGKNCDRGKRQESTGEEPESETVDSVEKQCSYCETAVSAFSIHTGYRQTQSMGENQTFLPMQNIYIYNII